MQILEAAEFIPDSIWYLEYKDAGGEVVQDASSLIVGNTLRTEDGGRGSGSCRVEKRGISGFRFCITWRLLNGIYILPMLIDVFDGGLEAKKNCQKCGRNFSPHAGAERSHVQGRSPRRVDQDGPPHGTDEEV